MEKLLIFIKHRFRIIWGILEWGNGQLFSILYKRKMENTLEKILNEFSLPGYILRRLHLSDAKDLFEMINSQETQDLMYFKPHGFDLSSIQKQFMNKAFLMMGVFRDQKLAGYFFLRFFANKKCFVGRLIDKNYRGQGIGEIMNKIMYETAWKMGFRCLSTISKNNRAVMRAHAKNPRMVILKEIQNDYLLIEFMREESSGRKGKRISIM